MFTALEKCFDFFHAFPIKQAEIVNKLTSRNSCITNTGTTASRNQEKMELKRQQKYSPKIEDQRIILNFDEVYVVKSFVNSFTLYF